MRPNTRKPICALAAATAVVVGSLEASAQDNLSALVDEATATGDSPLASFGYDPLTDSAYVASFGASGSLRKISGVTSGSPTFETMVSEAQWTLYYRDGDPNTSAGTPLPGGLLLNPQTVGTHAPYTQAWLIDGVRVPSSGTDPALSKRLYQYNLQMVMPNPNPGNIPTTPPFYDGRDVFTTRVTLADMNAAAGAPSTNTTSNVARQFAWSEDGQRIYFTDSGTVTLVGGVWKADPLSGAVSRIYAGAGQSVEVAATSVSPGVDRIFIRGTADTGNTDDGIDYIDHDGTNTTAPATLLSGTAVRDFLETTTDAMNVTAMAVDANGDLFFNVSGGSATAGTQRRAVLRYDREGRLSKVVSYDERDLLFTGAVGTSPNPNANVSKMQPHTVTYEGAAGSFEVTRVFYAEASPVNSVGAFWAFKAGDFDRDNVVDQNDVALFKTKLTTRGTPVADTLDLKYDLTGNNAVDWKDVKTLQQFYPFHDGDANIDQVVNLADFNALAGNFGQSGKTWIDGDFTGDDLVNLADFNILAGNFGLTASGPDVTADDWAALAAAVPEPASFAFLSLGAAALLRRRQRGR